MMYQYCSWRWKLGYWRRRIEWKLYVFRVYYLET